MNVRDLNVLTIKAKNELLVESMDLNMFFHGVQYNIEILKDKLKTLKTNTNQIIKDSKLAMTILYDALKDPEVTKGLLVGLKTLFEKDLMRPMKELILKTTKNLRLDGSKIIDWIEKKVSGTINGLSGWKGVIIILSLFAGTDKLKSFIQDKLDDLKKKVNHGFDFEGLFVEPIKNAIINFLKNTMKIPYSTIEKLWKALGKVKSIIIDKIVKSKKFINGILFHNVHPEEDLEKKKKILNAKSTIVVPIK